MKGSKHLPYYERLRVLGLFSLKKRKHGVILSIHAYKYLKRRCRGQGQALFSAAQWQDKRPWAQTERQEVLSEHQETLLYYALAQVVQRGCGVALLGDHQKPLGHGPRVLSVSLSRGLVVQIVSRGPFQPQPLNDSVNGSNSPMTQGQY